MIANLIFLFQLVCITVFGLGQAIKMLTTTEGVSVIWIISSEIFFGLNYWLVWIAHQKRPTAATAQAKFVYQVWLIIGVLELWIVIWNGGQIWNGFDTVATAIIIAGTVITAIYANNRELPISTPSIKAVIAILAIGVPQLMMGFNIHACGGDGLAATTVIVGHISVATRFGQLLFALGNSRDANCLSAIASESANWGSWIFVTAIWMSR